jgi:hypothetical protein
MSKKKPKEGKAKDPHAVYLGQLGGRARRKKLSPEKRREIAQKAANDGHNGREIPVVTSKPKRRVCL